MLDNLRGMAVFASVVGNGSFSGSAKQMGITTSAVSQQIRSLEKDLGVVLLHRSTRKISLTEAGESFYKNCQHIVNIANQSKIELDLLKDELTGGIRIATTPELAVNHVMPALKAWLADNDELQVHLEADNSYIDIIEKRIDVALRMSRRPADNSFTSEVLTSVEQVLVASPEYVKLHSAVTMPEDLNNHKLVGISLIKEPLVLELSDGSRKKKLKLNSRMTTNNVFILKSLALSGSGIARIMSLDVMDELASGRLVRVLPSWQLPEYKLYAVTLKRDQQPQKVAQCLNLIKAHFTQL